MFERRPYTQHQQQTQHPDFKSRYIRATQTQTTADRTTVASDDAKNHTHSESANLLNL